MQYDKRIDLSLIRHGATEANVKRHYAGLKNDDKLLNPNETVCLCCDGADIIKKCDKVFCGSKVRCIQTARLIFPTNELLIISDITEIDFGDFEGKGYEELKDDPDYERWIESGGLLCIPNGEDVQTFVARSMEAFRGMIMQTKDGGRYALVCHGGNIMAIMSTLLNGDYYDYMVGNYEGYLLKLLISDEDISCISYDRIGRIGGA